MGVSWKLGEAQAGCWDCGGRDGKGRVPRCNGPEVAADAR